jgi:hypothetical protein
MQHQVICCALTVTLGEGPDAKVGHRDAETRPDQREEIIQRLCHHARRRDGQDLWRRKEVEGDYESRERMIVSFMLRAADDATPGDLVRYTGAVSAPISVKRSSSASVTMRDGQHLWRREEVEGDYKSDRGDCKLCRWKGPVMHAR